MEELPSASKWFDHIIFIISPMVLVCVENITLNYCTACLDGTFTWGYVVAMSKRIAKTAGDSGLSRTAVSWPTQPRNIQHGISPLYNGRDNKIYFIEHQHIANSIIRFLKNRVNIHLQKSYTTDCIRTGLNNSFLLEICSWYEFKQRTIPYNDFILGWLPFWWICQ